MYVLRFIHIYYTPFTICICKCGAALSQLLLLRGAAVGQHLECGLALGMGERSACGAERESLRLRRTHYYRPNLFFTHGQWNLSDWRELGIEDKNLHIDFEALVAIKKQLDRPTLCFANKQKNV